MKKFIVSVQRITLYEVDAQTHEDAITAVCEGQGIEVDDTTMDMFADEVQGEAK
jgi:ribosomal protein L12E/L44/L45/RPP1/RPP2